MKFQDHFSGHARVYADFRPKYPQDLYVYLKKLCPNAQRVWDCATGNGQAAEALAEHFPFVYATDASAEQIAAATPKKNIEYSVALAEKTSLKDHSVGLVTVAQALHWFRHEAFYSEVNRVLERDGVIAIWCYELAFISKEVDEWVDHYYRVTLDGYWPPERKWIDEGYRTILFPFREISPPEFQMKESWDASQWLGYLRSWSASQKWMKEKGEEAFQKLESRLLEAWGDPKMRKTVRWPLRLRVGRKS